MSNESKVEKPVGARAGCKRLGTKIRFRNPVFRVREDMIEFPSGERRASAYLERSGALIVVPVTREGAIVLINQYRYSVDEWGLEVPAGGTHDSPNDSLEAVARRELREEVGATCE